MNNHDLSVAPASHGRPDRGYSASVIGTKAQKATSGGTGSGPLPQVFTEFYGPSVAPAAGSKADELTPITSTTSFCGGAGPTICPEKVPSKSHPSWGHFANDEDDTRWFSDLYVPSWAIFIFGLAVGITLSWLVL